jgi:hypothetical protein
MNQYKHLYDNQSPSESIVLFIHQMYVPWPHDHFITFSSKPAPPHLFFDALKTGLNQNWKAAAWNQFKKDQKIDIDISDD